MYLFALINVSFFGSLFLSLRGDISKESLHLSFGAIMSKIVTWVCMQPMVSCFNSFFIKITCEDSHICFHMDVYVILHKDVCMVESITSSRVMVTDDDAFEVIICYMLMLCNEITWVYGLFSLGTFTMHNNYSSARLYKEECDIC